MTDKKRILLTSGTNLLGRALEVQLTPKFEVLGLTPSEDPVTNKGLVRCNLSDKNALKKVFEELKPWCVIHCADSLLDGTTESPELIRNLNVEATRILAELAAGSDTIPRAWFLFVSSDQVFDGSSLPPYSTSLDPKPISVYGKSKYEAEQILKQISPFSGILRIPLLYGQVQKLEDSTVTQLALDVAKGAKVRMDNWKIHFPTLAQDVAFVCEALISRKLKHCGLHGFWHWSSNEKLTKYQMAIEIASVLGISSLHLVPIDDPVPDVAQSTQLDAIALVMMGIGRRTKFRDNLIQILEPWKAQLLNLHAQNSS